MTRKFGELPGDGTVEVVTLGSDSGLQAEILTLGGTLHSLTMPVNGKRIPLVLSLNDLPSYLADTMYVGQLVGRYANRISGASFELGGKRYRLTANESSYTLHGGDVGFGKYIWKILDLEDRKHVKLGHRSPAGINGFPGNLDVTALLSLQDNLLTLVFEAVTDAPTPISFTWHPYFNLSGNFRVPTTDHRLELAAGHYLPVSSSWLPTGEIAQVDDTPFDFRKAKSIRVPPKPIHPQLQIAEAFNHYWVLDGDRDVAGTLYSPESGVHMRIRTSSPGMQVYDGFALRQQYPDTYAVSIEPANYPDAPNHPQFPSSILLPGTTHRSQMSFEFSC